jgi:predicted DNA-binding protein
MLKPFNTKLKEEQIRLLDEISERTHIPKSRLVRQAIDLLIAEYQNDVITPQFVRLVDESISENLHLLKRL